MQTWRPRSWDSVILDWNHRLSLIAMGQYLKTDWVIYSIRTGSWEGLPARHPWVFHKVGLGSDIVGFLTDAIFIYSHLSQAN